MILDRYFARRFLQSFAMIGGVFLTLVILVDMVEQVRRFQDVEVTFGQILGLTLLNAPGTIDEILPLLVILSTIALFIGLARSSELIVTRAAGRSGIRALAAPALMAFVIGFLAVTMLNPIAAATSERYQRLIDTYRTGGPSVVSFSREGVWLRQGSDRGQAVIHAAGYGSDPVTLYDVTILAYAPQGGGPVRQIRARTARLDDGAWVLSDAKVWPLTPGLNPETSSEVHATLRIPTTLTEERVRESLGSPEGVSIYEMPETIRDLKQAGFSTRRYEVWFQSELARPLFLTAMVLVGAAFTMRHARMGGTGPAALAAVLLGFGLYFVRNFARILGENGQIPVVLAAWAPPVAALLLTFGLLLHAEDG